MHNCVCIGFVQYAQYQRFGAEECVLKAGGVLCPQPGCGAGILADADCTRIVCLNGCGVSFYTVPLLIFSFTETVCYQMPFSCVLIRNAITFKQSDLKGSTALLLSCINTFYLEKQVWIVCKFHTYDNRNWEIIFQMLSKFHSWIQIM